MLHTQLKCKWFSSIGSAAYEDIFKQCFSYTTRYFSTVYTFTHYKCFPRVHFVNITYLTFWFIALFSRLSLVWFIISVLQVNYTFVPPTFTMTYMFLGLLICYLKKKKLFILTKSMLHTYNIDNKVVLTYSRIKWQFSKITYW